MSIRAILLPEVGDEKTTRFTPAAPSKALAAMAPTTLAQLPGSGQMAIQTISSLVHQAPCFHLHLGVDVSSIPAAISQLLDHIS